MSTLYIVDPGVMQDVSVHKTLRDGRAVLDDTEGARLYRSSGKGKLDEWVAQFNEWSEVDPICGSAPIKVWKIARRT